MWVVVIFNPYYNTTPNIQGTQRGTTILTTTQYNPIIVASILFSIIPILPQYTIIASIFFPLSPM